MPETPSSRPAAAAVAVMCCTAWTACDCQQLHTPGLRRCQTERRLPNSGVLRHKAEFPADHAGVETYCDGGWMGLCRGRSGGSGWLEPFIRASHFFYSRALLSQGTCRPERAVPSQICHLNVDTVSRGAIMELRPRVKE